MSDQFETITYTVERGRARIALNRPEKRNAISVQMQQELESALWFADDDTRVHCVVLSGNGPEFCSGYDLGQYEGPAASGTQNRRGRKSIDDDAWRLEAAQRCRMALFDMHKPVIAQVHGRCLAGGTDLALLCDLVICSDESRFGFPPARAQGSLPSHMWLYHLGPQWAKRLLLTGDSLGGKDAAALGLALKSVPQERLSEEVDALADRLELVDVDLLSCNKRIVNMGLELMGARTLQRMAAEMDARGHLAKSREEFRSNVQQYGLKEALRLRDGPFGDDLIQR
ncbi:crotonase/enoyl-CoA hydratase family protein [Hydrogenophaga sp. BPS33]|uniref:crotonase/enoyl-CoA hydratase family protein n=1 Tax=Hydrogenophaga sp. BPS33 TaxID=2651974 RepID=UPI00131F94E8|nr:crotonase/enoyl-CoA hydratase family protein [Hydrogenophaga sp. BPS33]QHE84766.1 crotonase/enoyl-CoA hydratase family protein [Hydrogenophaga sp. BPS33]